MVDAADLELHVQVQRIRKAATNAIEDHAVADRAWLMANTDNFVDEVLNLPANKDKEFKDVISRPRSPKGFKVGGAVYLAIEKHMRNPDRGHVQTRAGTYHYTVKDLVIFIDLQAEPDYIELLDTFPPGFAV